MASHPANTIDVDVTKFRRSMQALMRLPDAELEENLRLWTTSTTVANPANIVAGPMDRAVELLAARLIDPLYTESIRDNFPDLLMLIVTRAFPLSGPKQSGATHVAKCVALSKLVAQSQHIKKFAQSFFTTQASPFAHADPATTAAPTPKRAKRSAASSTGTDDLELVRCCHRFLHCDTSFYRTAWNWSAFLQRFWATPSSSPVQQLYCNAILATLGNMSTAQLQQLNGAIDAQSVVDRQLAEQVHDETRALVAAQPPPNEDTMDESASEIIPADVQRWSFASDAVTCVEGVLLPIFDASNRRWHQQNTATHSRTILVSSTRQNLRSLALGIASDRAICLSGPVGCGKTGLVEYVARLTGRVAVPWSALNAANEAANGNGTVQRGKRNKGGKKRRAAEAEAAAAAALAAEQGIIVADGSAALKPARSGFLRIQLGDQTDSKMLLGQYRCTDVPGEFVWQAGALTQAVQHGYWLLLEDIDLATQDVTVALTALLETGTLSVPGVNESLRVAPGFQLFVTLRQQTKQSNCSQLAQLQMLNKYMFGVNMLPLSGAELSEMVGELFPRFAQIDKGIVDRMVKVFLKFSCGDHGDGEDEELAIGDAEAAQPLNEETAAARNNSTSNRLVSTRDLIKWCTRSYGTFADTSEANRYLVLKNAADLFCGYLPDVQKRHMICAIGAELNISPGMCDAFASEHLPQVQLTSEEITVGRVRLQKHLLEEEKPGKRASGGDGEEEVTAHKKQKTDLATYVNVVQQNRQKAPTFSFTRIAVCLMERIAVAVQQNEPVLLVGETGVGKTSSVQYLAHHTQHKLVVVNMNNQSDVSDLIGGFKPVDFAFVLGPLRTEFEGLFRRSLNAAKNERFLANLSACFQRGEFVVLIKTMIKTIAMVLGKGTTDSTQPSDPTVVRRWRELNVKLQKLEAQLRKSMNISFAFVPGSLVNCIQRGDWVLLDEINLASAETLECLSTILEPDGSVVLLEKGDLVPVRRHPEFRIFACMNPSTDVGKKELPVGIRNRFTEFYADELEKRSDLEILIGDYLRNTGIQPAKQSAIAQLYEKLRQLARLELNDGLGNRPVFTLRTLCRALAVCAKNLCGSVERNLYESFCLSFLTQLDGASHAQVLQLIQRTMLGNARAVLSQQIPRPAAGDFVGFEGYWIETGGRELQECEHYILTDSVRLNLKDLARVVSIGRLPVLLQGPTSAGKTSLIEYVAKRSGNRCMRINNHEHTDLQEYIGTYTADANGKLSFHEGVLVEAMRHGYWIILDELNLASSDILEALNRVLDDNRELFIAETQTLVRAHPNFMLFATQNPPGLYGGRKALSRAFKNRFIELHFADIPRSELEVILERRCQIPRSYAQKMVKTMAELHVHRQTTVKSSFTLRDLFRWGNRYTLADPKLLEDSKYDWNQHLVDEGYLALSAKIRADGDVEVIERTLLANFRKKIDVGELFELTERTSKVTRSILERIAAHPRFERIVWTFNMRRMAVLAAKALEFNEPVLLVGSTGCGKTTVCQILADICAVELRILNCHMHTEGADFLGGLRPYRGGDEVDAETAEANAQKLFEWADGPLVLAMQQGSFFLADEISLAEDSVLERLNCILEPERTVLLSEKGGGGSGAEDPAATSDLIVTAAPGFQFLATMNPGGDFGKKELSPALRNRFTEIWCRATDSADDLGRIAEHLLRTAFGALNDARVDALIADLAATIVQSVFFMRDSFAKFTFSIRDVLAWIEYVTKHARLHEVGRLSLAEALVFGMETMFLDALEMLPHDSVEEIETMRKKALRFLLDQLRKRLQLTVQLADIQAAKGTEVELSVERFGIRPFFLERAENSPVSENDQFVFTAPTTQRNLFCLLSALSLHKPVLLEGPPGVGKTSLIEQVTAALGYKIVRINLCEHTDLADLFGSDLPATDEEKDADEDQDQAKDAGRVGSFVWRDGPLLAALKAPNTWILLDELNLAPQSVLEGLNAVLDHRGEVYIPELNKTFRLGAATRIFASQNPLRQGGGRKGLPLSFLNRFTKVYLRKLQREDLHHVVRVKYARFFEEVSTRYANETTVDLCSAMVAFTEHLDAGLAAFEFGYKGGPFEVNLRDILRWCEFLGGAETGCSAHATLAQFRRTVYEKMKLVYCQRMRSAADTAYIRAAFAKHFECDAEELEEGTRDVALYWTDQAVYLDDIRTTTEIGAVDDVKPRSANAPLLLSSQREVLKNMAECVHMQKPVILCGPTDCGKTKTIDVLCTLINRRCVTDAIDDSVTGSFQQIDLNRHLEEIAARCEELLLAQVQHYALGETKKARGRDAIVRLLGCWERYTQLVDAGLSATEEAANHSAVSADLIAFRERLQSLHSVYETIAESNIKADLHKLPFIRQRLAALTATVQHATTLNSGGHFEWVDSRIVTSFRFGHIICLEHVNLCSSAILDRLNPMFEQDGTLLLAEKGVTAAAEPEIVVKHPAFNAFLTLDPKNGEISRAMRNRCIELCIAREEYAADDLRTLCWAAGVPEMAVIEAVVQVHQRCRAVSEFSAMGVAHVTKCADLVRRNRQLGCDAKEALQRSALEVYVRAANVDLTGFGLPFYRQQLRSAIAEVVDALELREDLFEYANVVDQADELNAFALVRKECEVFLTTMRALLAGRTEEVAVQLRGLFAAFEGHDLHCDELLLRLLLAVIYECAAPADLQLRRVYLAAAFDRMQREHPEHALIAELRTLNQQLFDDIRSNATSNNETSDLPWNTEIFPRLLRFYQPEKTLSASAQLRLSALLASRAFLATVCLGGSTKLSQIDALTFSHAVQAKQMQNVPGQELVRLLHAYLTQVQPHLVAVLEQQEQNWELGAEEAVELVAAFLWHNRLYACTQRQLFTADKRVDDALVNLISMHIKWLEKHLIAKLPAGHSSTTTPFDRTRSAMAHIVQSTQHPLHRLRKQFVKQMTGFLPYYTDAQIELHQRSSTFERQTALTPQLGAAFERDVIQRREAIVCDETVQKLKRHLVGVGADVELTVQRLGHIDSAALSSDLPLSQSVAVFVADLQQLSQVEDNNVSIEDFDLDTSFEHITQLLQREDPIRADRFVTELLPLREYFALKSLNAVLLDRHTERRLNPQYFDAIQSLGLNELRALRHINSPTFAVCERLWHSMWQSLAEGQSTWDQTVAVLPRDFYRNYASFRRSLTAALQQFSLRSLAVKPASRDGPTEQLWAGPVFTASALTALFDHYGAAKSCGLVQLPSWQASLQQMSQLLWSNSEVCGAQTDFSFEQANLSASWSRTQQLLFELEAVFAVFYRKQTKADGNEFIADFVRLVDTLKELHRTAQPQVERVPQSPAERSASVRITSALSALTGAIEINLLTHLPLLDPVEKERLKQLYRTEDQLHLQQLLRAIECMQITMNYRDLAANSARPFATKLAAISVATDQQSVPLRPEECLYAALSKDITHFVQTCCQPKALLELLSSVEATLQAENSGSSCLEAIKRIELWCSNSCQFVHHTLAKYEPYYMDFVLPVRHAIQMLAHGLRGLRHCLQQRTIVAASGEDQEGVMNALLGNLIEYPSVEGLRILPAAPTTPEKEQQQPEETISRVLAVSDNYDSHYLRLLKVKLNELEHNISLSSTISPADIRSLNALLALFNGVWKQQEDRRRKHAEEEESLYVTKTRCAEEDEDEVAVREVRSMFPNTIEADFGDLIDAVTLEQKPEPIKGGARSKSTMVDLLRGEDITEICAAFTRIMARFSRSYYYHPKFSGGTDVPAATHDYVRDFKARFGVFVELFPRFSAGLNSSIDEQLYPGVSLLVGDRMDEMNMLKLSDTANISYNFYKDSNIAEVITCSVVMRKIEARASAELELYPEHAGLLDILSIIRRIDAFPTTSPVMRFSSGFQILNKKLNEWNKLASRSNTMIDLEVEVGGYIQRWMKLELQCWRECLSQSFAKVQARAHRYWFFVYNLVQEYLCYDRKRNVLQCDLTDFAQVERNFDEAEEVAVDETLQDTTTRMRSSDVVKVLKRFIESSNYADFAVRMRILKSFEQYLYMVRGSELADRRRNTLITILHNLHMYFAQFAGDVDARLKSQRSGVEKKLKEFVKMESYSKYLSYFSQDANISQVHRKLHKFLKEFEQQVGERIAAVFLLKDSQLGDVNAAAVGELKSASQKKNAQYLEAQRSHHLVEVGNFVCPSRPAEFFSALTALTGCDSQSLLLRADRMFARSRNIVKHTLLHSPFQPLIYNLHQLLADQIESLDYLRRLEVDRTQEKPKQKVQAKQILQQKRKALTDFYKVLTRLGFSYRAGLLEATLTAELTDLKIAPFCVRTMVASDCEQVPRIQPALLALDNKLDEYFVRGVYKLKVLQTVLLTPHADIGLQHLERIKGFGVDVFVLVQQQRKALSGFVLQLNDLREHVRNVGELRKCADDEADTVTTSFEQLRTRFAQMQVDLARVCDVVLQYQLLFKCVPSAKAADINRVLAEADTTGERTAVIRDGCADVLTRAQALLAVLVQQEDCVFYAAQTVQANDAKYAGVCEAIDGLVNGFSLGANATSVHGRALIELQHRMQEQHAARIQVNKDDEEIVDEFANTNVEIENMIHAMLFAMQSIYKKHSDHELEAGAGDSKAANPEATENASEAVEADDPDPIQLNHLKVLVTNSLHSDVELLAVPKVCHKLANILLTVRHSADAVARRAVAQRLLCVLPILEQYQRLCLFYLVQQLSAHKVSAKMAATLLTVFVELGAKGFCVPPDLMSDEDGDAGEQKEEKGSEGFGLEDGTGEKDVSDKLESEDQLDSAQKPGDDKDTDDKEDADCKEEKGIDMSDDFDSKLQDLDKKEPNSDSDDDDDDDEDPDKQMGETEDGAEKLDDQIWGSDEEKDEEEEDNKDMNEEEDGKGSKDEDEKHNDLANENNETKQNEGDEQNEGLDAADNEPEKKKKEKDIDQLDEPDVGEDQANPYHNDLEEPPEPEDVDLGDNFNLDKEDANDQDDRPEENPFDIDTMKDQMEVDENEEEEDKDGDADADDKAEDGKDADGDDSDSGDEEKDKDESKEDEGEDGDTKREDDQPTEEEQPADQDEPAESQIPAPKEDGDDDEPKPDETPEEDAEKPQPKDEDYHQSKDKASMEENVQSMPEQQKDKGSLDQVQKETAAAEPQKQEDMDAQDTGEDNEAIGQAENEESKSGHQGVAETKETKSADQQQPKDAQEKRKQGNTDEERTLGDPDQQEKKQLKTIDKVNQNEQPEKEPKADDADTNREDEAEEYQHVKEAKPSDKTTLDNATEEQSKRMQHEDEVEDKEEPMDTDEQAAEDQLPEDETNPADEDASAEQLKSDETDVNSDKPAAKRERQPDERAAQEEPIEVEGDYVDTMNVPRAAESTAHTAMDLLQDKEAAQEPTQLETLEMRRMFEAERAAGAKFAPANVADFETWNTIANKMLPNARELCEQLRLILEPTKCTRLKGDYRTGRRINLKKIIPYIASQFRKDKIWLRRTKPAQRDYKITVAIDDSKSMAHNNSKVLTLEAIALVSQALTLLESGRLSVMSFGERPKIVLDHAEQFDGPKLCGALTFEQNQSRIAELMHFARVATAEQGGSGGDNGVFENLLLVLSDGRNIFSEGEQVVRNAVKLARMQRMFIVYVIIDNPENKSSILDIRVPMFAEDRKSMTFKSYLDTFPFPYYVIVRDLAQLPLVLSDAMRQWFELVNSEQ